MKKYLFSWDFNTHITTGDHDTIRSSDNFVNLSNTFVIFNFGNNFDAGTIITKSVTDLISFTICTLTHFGIDPQYIIILGLDV